MSTIKSLTLLIALLICLWAMDSPAAQKDPLEQAQALMNKGQYDQAKIIYQQILSESPGSDKALEAQKQMVIIHIATNNQAEADAAFEQLIAGFSRHKDIAKSVWQIARQYNSKGNAEKAIGLHQYNVNNYPTDKNAVWSQVEIVQSYIRNGNNAADAATDELINKFSDQPLLPKEIYL